MATANEIQRQMDAVRQDIDEDVEELVEEAKSFFDWRDYVRAQPLAAVGIAAVVGYALIPKRNQIVQADPETVSRMLNAGRIVMAPNASVKQTKPWAAALLTTMAGVAIRSVAGQVGHQLATKFSEKVDPPQQ